MLHSDIVAVIPAHNEEGTIAALVHSIRHDHGLAVVVVDDLSCDATVQRAYEAGATVLPLRVQLGAWGAIQAGFRYALTLGCKYCLTLDADGQHLPEMIPGLVTEILANPCDMVIGSCPERGSTLRRMAWSIFRTIGGFTLSDLTSGFRIYSRQTVEILVSSNASLLDYQDMGVLMLLRDNGMCIREISVCMLPRKCGHSRVFSTWYQVAQYMMKTSLLCASKIAMPKSPNSISKD